MPTSSNRGRAGRKGHHSCDFCRMRKLRCDRPLPCTSCRSRGKTCHFGNENLTSSTPRSQNQSTAVSNAASSQPASALRDAQDQHMPAQLSSLQQPITPTPTTGPTLPPSTSPLQEDLLAELQNLRQLTHQLEARVLQSTASHQPREGNVVASPSTAPAKDEVLTPQSDLGQISDVVAHLQRVSMSRSSLDSVCADDLVLRVGHIRTIPNAPTYTSQLGKPTPCIWLPYHCEAKLLVESYMEDVSYIQHVVHHASLTATVANIYEQVNRHDPVNPGHLILLLSILASATHVWVPREGVGSDQSLFLSAAQANAQTPLWVKAAYSVLNVAQDNVLPTLETIQGITILSCVVVSLEGVSIRLRSLLSTGLLLSRELNFHRIDSASNATATATDSVRIEMSRRIWWYLVATDWLMAARYGGPCEGIYQSNPLHMMVNKPRHINDVELIDGEDHFEMPMCRPTDMSYFLQRLRLAEISRSIVDLNLVSTGSSGRPNYYCHIMAMDFELDQFINQIPRFFRLDSYEPPSDSGRPSNIFIQAYMLNSHIHTQRCKLHLAYLTSGPSDNPAHAASRHTCLQSARQLIRAERQLIGSQHSFVRIRLRLAAILYSVFMASIVLLMDACVNRSSYLQDDFIHGDAAEALLILEETRSHSLAAAKLLESLLQIVTRYRSQHDQQQPVAQRACYMQHQNGRLNSSSAYQESTGSTCVQHGHGSSLFVPNLTSADNSMSDGALTYQTPQEDDFLTASTHDAMSPKLLEWNDLFSDLASASFF